MANSKISALTSATTPLAGTETLPIVQSSTTKQVSVANLTAGRTVSATTYRSGDGSQAAPAYSFTSDTTSGIFYGSGYVQVSSANALYALFGSANIYLQYPTTVYGNITQGTAAKGINFTANTPASGMTSQLLNWYEEGTFTATIKFGGNNTGATYSAQDGRYTRIGNRLFFDAKVTFTAKGTSTGTAQLLGIPFNPNASSNAGLYTNYYGNMLALTGVPYGRINVAAAGFNLSNGSATGTTDLTDTNFTNTTDFRCSGFYDI